MQFFTEAQIFPNLDLTLEIEKDLIFGPDTIKAYANRYKTTRNNIFIGSIHDRHNFNFEDLGGVRIIQ